MPWPKGVSAPTELTLRQEESRRQRRLAAGRPRAQPRVSLSMTAEQASCLSKMMRLLLRGGDTRELMRTELAGSVAGIVLRADCRLREDDAVKQLRAVGPKKDAPTRAQVIALKSAGKSTRAISIELGIGAGTVWRIVLADEVEQFNRLSIQKEAAE